MMLRAHPRPCPWTNTMSLCCIAGTLCARDAFWSFPAPKQQLRHVRGGLLAGAVLLARHEFCSSYESRAAEYTTKRQTMGHVCDERPPQQFCSPMGGRNYCIFARRCVLPVGRRPRLFPRYQHLLQVPRMTSKSRVSGRPRQRNGPAAPVDEQHSARAGQKVGRASDEEPNSFGQDDQNSVAACGTGKIGRARPMDSKIICARSGHNARNWAQNPRRGPNRSCCCKHGPCALGGGQKSWEKS